MAKRALEIPRNITLPDGKLNELEIDRFFRQLSNLINLLYPNIETSTTTATINAASYQWNGDTDGGAFTYTLPAGIQDRQYKIVNVGTSGNVLTIEPAGAELLIGANSGFELQDGESLIICYDETDGWY